jgi:hypothetical protein
MQAKTILEASDWPLGLRAIFPGRGDGPMAFRGLEGSGGRKLWGISLGAVLDNYLIEVEV